MSTEFFIGICASLLAAAFILVGATIVRGMEYKIVCDRLETPNTTPFSRVVDNPRWVFDEEYGHLLIPITSGTVLPFPIW